MDEENISRQELLLQYIDDYIKILLEKKDNGNMDYRNILKQEVDQYINKKNGQLEE